MRFKEVFNIEITQYTGVEVVNTNTDTLGGKVGFITGFLDGELKKGEYYTLQFKIIDMLNMPSLNWMYITYSDGTEQKLQDVNLNEFETVGTLNGKAEKLCYFNFKANGSGLGRIIIARKQTVVDVVDSTAYYLREIDLKPGKIFTDFTLNTREQAFETIKLYSSIQSVAGEINMKVGRNDVISSINMSPEQIKINSRVIYLRAEDVRVAWNNINDSISLRSDELAMYGAGTGSGKRLSLKRGLLNTYRDTDNGFLGYYGMDRTYEKYYGTTNLGSYYSWFFGIAQDLGMDHDTDISMNKKYYLYVSFADHESYPKGTHIVEAPLWIWKNVQMKGNNIYEIGNLYFDADYYSRVSKMSNKGLLIEGDPELQIGIRDNGKFKVGIQMLSSYPNTIYIHRDIDMQGCKLLNVGASAATFAQMPIRMRLFLDTNIEEPKKTLIDNIDIIDINQSELGVIPKNYSDFKDNEFDKDQLLFSLARKVKELEEELRLMKEGV